MRKSYLHEQSVLVQSSSCLKVETKKMYQWVTLQCLLLNQFPRPRRRDNSRTAHIEADIFLPLCRISYDQDCRVYSFPAAPTYKLQLTRLSVPPTRKDSLSAPRLKPPSC